MIIDILTCEILTFLNRINLIVGIPSNSKVAQQIVNQ